MILVKYSRLNRAKYIPHLDTLRGVIMTIRRAGLKVEYSQGYNPHMQLFFSPPLPIGTESVSEYFCAYTMENKEHFMTEFNKFSPDGIKIVDTFYVDKEPNISKISVTSSYEITFPNAEKCATEINKIMSSAEYTISYDTKDGVTNREIRAKIHQLSYDKGKIYARLSSGNDNLRADRLIKQIAKNCEVDANNLVIIRQNIFTDKDGLASVDSLFSAKA